MDHTPSEQLIDQLRTAGVKAFVVCAGSRNSSLTLSLLKSYDLQIFNHFEEREASFFALGLSKRSQTPVAILTTSGTAAAEILPACIEAHYSGIRLVIVTADRPERYRGTGAPQAIEQSTLFGGYCSHRYDLVEGCIDSLEIAQSGPTHINICIEEASSSKRPSGKNSFSNTHATLNPLSEDLTRLETALTGVRSPLIIIGELHPNDTRAVTSLCKRLNAPVFAEALSGLRESETLKHHLITGSERVLHRTTFDCILRIGGVPTCRYWRDLEYDAAKRIISLDSKPFSGTPNGQLIQQPIAAFIGAFLEASKIQFTFPETMRAFDDKATKELHTLLYQLPHAEPSLMYQLSHVIHEHDALYLGNSLPVREWDLAASRKKQHPLVLANRGANGIDGQLSTFFGSIDRTRHNWGVFGDLTTLYGLSSLWITQQLGPLGATLCVINNGGGKIFERVNGLQAELAVTRTHDLFINAHTVSFEHWAKMWGIAYERITEFSSHLRKPGLTIAELIPDETQTKEFWSRWDGYWKGS